MKTLIAAMMATAFISAPALACSFGKTAKKTMTTHTASIVVDPKQEAMSTYDPAEKPVFEDSVEVTDETAPVIKEETSE